MENKGSSLAGDLLKAKLKREIIALYQANKTKDQEGKPYSKVMTALYYTQALGDRHLISFSIDPTADNGQVVKMASAVGAFLGLCSYGSADTGFATDKLVKTSSGMSPNYWERDLDTEEQAKGALRLLQEIFNSHNVAIPSECSAYGHSVKPRNLPRSI